MLKKFYNSMSRKYLESGGGKLSGEEVGAYLRARMPATFAAVSQVLKEVRNRTGYKLLSVLDLGAGLGAGALAAKEVFPEIDRCTLIENNEQMVASGRKLIDAEWVTEDLIKAEFTPHDLVLFSYSYGEIPQMSRVSVLKKAWEAASILVLIEPGTPRGFKGILEAREKLLEWGGFLTAPCPHGKKCPMEGGKWCHFSVRLERSKEHRQAKGAKLGWEDEKYSYLAFSKRQTEFSESRIIGHPQKRTNHVALQLCSEEGLEQRIITKKDKALYKKARKAKWGDCYED